MANPKVRPPKLARGRGGHAAAILARQREAQRIAIRRRQAEAYRLYFDERRPMTLQQIADQFKVSIFTASMDVRTERERVGYEADDRKNLAVVRDRHGRHLQAIIAANMRHPEKAANARTALAAMEREARLYGLDPERPGTYSAEQVVSLAKAMTGAFLELVEDQGKRIEFALRIRRQMGALSADVIDAEAVRRPPKPDDEKAS
jgi:hypothetical protein